jgi:hypothetical protein
MLPYWKASYKEATISSSEAADSVLEEESCELMTWKSWAFFIVFSEFIIKSSLILVRDLSNQVVTAKAKLIESKELNATKIRVT